MKTYHFTKWFLAALPFLALGFFASCLNVIGWLLAFLFGLITGTTFSRFPSTNKFSMDHSWPVVLTIIFIGMTLGGLPIWVIMGAVPMERPIMALGSVVTAALYIIGLGVSVGYSKRKASRHKTES